MWICVTHEALALFWEISLVMCLIFTRPNICCVNILCEGVFRLNYAKQERKVYLHLQ